MDVGQFWWLIEDSRAAGPRQMTTIREALRALRPADVADFCRHLDACLDTLYTHDLWAVAYIIRDGCSDDSFADFRSCVVANGEEMFALAATDAATFGLRYDMDGGCADCDSLQYIGYEVFEALTGEAPPRASPQPTRPAGEDWDEADLPQRFPKVWAHWS